MESKAQAVLITGCSSGIGAALCREFHQKGCKVIATARRIESVEEFRGDGFDTEKLDVNNRDDIRRVVGSVLEKYSRIDMLINNAGYAQIGPTVELSDSDLQSQLETNLFGPLALIREIAPSMKANGEGRIVNIGSISGIVSTPFAGAYCASKAAWHALSDALRMELLPFGIKVITVQPGAIESRFGQTALENTMATLKADSWYHAVRESIHARAEASQEDATPARDFAKCLVDTLLKDNPPPVIRLGKKSMFLPTLKALLPVRMLDRLLMKKFGLATIDSGDGN